jgi:2-oxoglutarate ferredoxin oxidoreductase subunit alpha
MIMDVTIKIGGQAGQGIQTVGHFLALVCREAGLFLMAVNDFESRIRGGHSFFQIRISDKPVHAPHHKVNLLIALDNKSYQIHQKEMLPEGLVLLNQAEEQESKQIAPVPFEELAEKAGAKITSNTVAAGAALGVLGAPMKLLEKILSNQFRSKGEDIHKKNVKAAELGYDAVKDITFKWDFDWKVPESKTLLIEGSQAIALGALAGDCRLGAFYPMSPATGIMAHLVGYSDDFPLVVEQAEDEIAAINMVIGGSFAGVRSMTATSGGGFSLMTEGLGLAAITETPVVIVNSQRPGPATGLPTRTAQADLHFVINASQDEFPRFVFAPGSPEQAYETMIRAFTLSEKYQVPAIVLTDQHLNDSYFIIEKAFSAPKELERYIVGDDQLEDASKYERFALDASGVSPRALPCMGDALVVVSSDEHRQDGHISESITNRIDMVDKRNSKIPDMRKEMNPPEGYFTDSDVVLVGWGSTKGAVREAVDILRSEDLNVGSFHFTDLRPLPNDAVEKHLKGKKKVIMVEQNSTAQLGRLIRQQTGIGHSKAILKYDGRPLYPSDIVKSFKEYARSS